MQNGHKYQIGYLGHSIYYDFFYILGLLLSVIESDLVSCKRAEVGY
jgi:hypothetical protein